MLRGGSTARAFIQSEAAGTEGREEEDSRREMEGRRFFTVDAVGMYSSFVGRRWSAESVAFREGE